MPNAAKETDQEGAERAAELPGKQRYVSALARLQSLPAIFKGVDLTLGFGWESRKASHYLWLWKKAGHVAPLGGHSDTYANLIVNRRPNWEAAALLAMPSAMVIGIECLRRAGWTTQIPSRPEIAVLSPLPRYQTDHFQVRAVPPSLHQLLEQGAQSSQTGRGWVNHEDRSLPSLSPAWALAYMLKSEGWGLCGLQPDDVYWDEVTEVDREQWTEAAFRLGLDAEAAPEIEGCDAQSEGCQPSARR